MLFNLVSLTLKRANCCQSSLSCTFFGADSKRLKLTSFYIKKKKINKLSNIKIYFVPVGLPLSVGRAFFLSNARSKSSK